MKTDKTSELRLKGHITSLPEVLEDLYAKPFSMSTYFENIDANTDESFKTEIQKCRWWPPIIDD